MRTIADHIGDLWLLFSNRDYRAAQLQTYSFWSIVFNCRKLRSDYIAFTAKRYAASVRMCLKRGDQPMDWRHTKQEFWEEELKQALGCDKVK